MKKKSIGIVTYHGAYNYGSFLQAYALQKIISDRYQVDCTIINYRKDEQKEFYSPIKKNNSIRNIVKNIVSIPYVKKLENRNNLFEKMINSELRLTKEYKNKKELENNVPQFDLLISGSDQIWNTGILDFDDVYLLNFKLNSIRISYAASMGSFPRLSTDEQDIFKQFLPLFSKISVREEVAKKIIERLTPLPVHVCVDPTLLLRTSVYQSLIKTEYLNSKLPKKDFIFFYSICYNKEMIERVMRFAEEKKLRVYMVFTGSIKLVKTKIRNLYVIIDASVSDFLYLIQNARYVCTSSFHGTVLSLIFRKEFFVINELKNGEYLLDSRMYNLLKKLNLQNRMINDSFKECPEEVNYYDIWANMQDYTRKSFDFLDESMELIGCTRN